MKFDFKLFYKNLKQSGKGILKLFPLLFGTMLLVSLAAVVVPKSFYKSIFIGNVVTDSLLGSLVGGVSAGNPILRYVIGGELIKVGVGLAAITGFLVAWVTVGVIQFPMEARLLGKKFALYRNLIAFSFSIITAIIFYLISIVFPIIGGGL